MILWLNDNIYVYKYKKKFVWNIEINIKWIRVKMLIRNYYYFMVLWFIKVFYLSKVLLIFVDFFLIILINLRYKICRNVLFCLIEKKIVLKWNF